MTVKLMALYRKPDHVDVFMKHYDEVHAPLVRKTPHLQKIIINHVTSSLMGEPPYSLIAEMTFPDRAQFDEAMKSAEKGRRART